MVIVSTKNQKERDRDGTGNIFEVLFPQTGTTNPFFIKIYAGSCIRLNTFFAISHSILLL